MIIFKWRRIITIVIIISHISCSVYCEYSAIIKIIFNSITTFTPFINCHITTMKFCICKWFIIRTNRYFFKVCESAAVIYICYAAATIKRIIANACYTVWYRNACQVATFIKYIVANIC